QHLGIVPSGNAVSRRACGSLSPGRDLRRGLHVPTVGRILTGDTCRIDQDGIQTLPSDYPTTHSDAEWRRLLSTEAYAVLRRHATERPGTSALLQEKRPGQYHCAGCNRPLFDGATKFESGSGWPSF